MSRSAVGAASLPTKTDLRCPRDGRVMIATEMRDATVDVCGACEGIFFDSGEMLGAAGIEADPSSWDLPETGGAVKEGTLRCPRCAEVVMNAQDVTLGERHVEVDRCGKCRGVWLDKGELDTIVAIGHEMRPALEAARAKAQRELAALGEPNMRPRPKTWKIVAALVAIVAIAGAIAAWVDAEKRARMVEPGPPPGTRAKGEEGCPCGCDHSVALADEVRKQDPITARSTIDHALRTIAAREEVGYVTERMIQHRLRLLHLAAEMGIDAPPRLARPLGRCVGAHVENDRLRACSALVVHGERVEIVAGHRKLITPSFRLWLEIENRSDRDRVVAMPSLRAAAARLPTSRWYLEGGRGDAWDGALRAGETVRVNVIGDIPERLRPETVVDATIDLDGLVLGARDEARATINFDP
jgi:Zn-finger nucleic acid-binding protein